MKLALAVATIGAATAHESYETWSKSAGKELNPERRAIFEANVAVITAHNVKHDSGESTFRMGLTPFSDLTAEEFKLAVSGGFKASAKNRAAAPTPILPAPTAKAVDWRTKGVVTPIQTQGVCGSCWAFSTTGAVESHYAIATGSLRKLSEQQLMDCSRTTGSRGCDGGDFDEGFTYITNNGGINSDKDYPYTSTSINCDKLEEKRKVATIDGYINVQREKPLQLMAGIELGPVSVAVSAGQPEWQHYASGVLNFLCAVNVDHAVLAVGYGTTNATGISLSGEYWIIKNSWGAAWGEEGYVRLKRGPDFYHNPVGMCGILTEPSYPNVTHRAPLPVPPPTPSHPSPDTMCNNCGESCEWTCAHDGVPSDPPLVCVSETKTGGLHCECAPVANTGPPPLCAVNASGVVSVVAKV